MPTSATQNFEETNCNVSNRVDMHPAWQDTSNNKTTYLFFFI